MTPTLDSRSQSRVGVSFVRNYRVKTADLTDISGTFGGTSEEGLATQHTALNSNSLVRNSVGVSVKASLSAVVLFAVHHLRRRRVDGSELDHSIYID